MSQIRFLIGTGGVGKTTTSTIVAVRQAQDFSAVHLLTIDPSMRLKSTLGLDHLDHHAKKVSLGGGRSLFAHGVNKSSGFDHLIGRESPEMLAKLLKNPIYLALSRRMPGAHEYAAWDELALILERDKPEILIVDTPPSAHLKDFLEAPSKILSFWEDHIQKYFQLGQSSHRSLLEKSLGTGFRVLEMLMGKTFFQSVVETLESINSIKSGILSRLRHTQQIVMDPRITEAWLVTTSEQLLHRRSPLPTQVEGLAITKTIINRDWSHFSTSKAEYGKMLERLNQQKLPGKIVRIPDQVEPPVDLSDIINLAKSLSWEK